MSAHGNRLDLSALEAFAQLPELVDACRRVLTDEHVLQGADRTAMFFEPAELSYCTNWHRDITFDSAAMPPEDWMRINGDPTFFVQVNCALWNDCSTWYVPGSVNRPDLATELAAAQAMPELDGQLEVERERRVIEYAAGMPGGVQLLLEPGDFALYQPNGWHIGAYSPYRRRATIHTSVWKPETIAWYQTWGDRRKAAAAAAAAAARTP